MVVGVVFVLLLFGLSIAAMVNIRSNKRKTSTITSYIQKTLSLLIILFLTIFQMPLFQIFVNPILCSSDSPYNSAKSCFSGKHSVYFSIGIISLIIYFLLLAVFVTLYSDINPCSNVPFSGPQNKILAAKCAFRIVIVLFYTLDFKGQFLSYFIGFCTACIILIIAVRYRRPIYYRKTLDLFSGTCDSALAWTYLGVVLQLVIDSDSDLLERKQFHRPALYLYFPPFFLHCVRLRSG